MKDLSDDFISKQHADVLRKLDEVLGTTPKDHRYRKTLDDAANQLKAIVSVNGTDSLAYDLYLRSMASFLKVMED